MTNDLLEGIPGFTDTFGRALEGEVHLTVFAEHTRDDHVQVQGYRTAVVDDQTVQL